MDAAEAGVDSVEHGNFQNEESICCMAEHATIWVPTIVTVSNLLENGRYPAETLAWIFETQKKGLQLAFEKDVVLAAGSDAGAYGVLHGKGIREEESVMRKILGAENGQELEKRLAFGEKKDPGKVLKIFCVSGFRKKFRIKRADNACVFARTVVSLNHFYKNFRENETEDILRQRVNAILCFCVQKMTVWMSASTEGRK